MLVIAYTGMNSFVCLDVRMNGFGRVMYIDIEDALDEHGMKQTYFLADNFAKFIAGLRPESA